MNKTVKIIIIVMFGISMWSIGSFIFGGTAPANTRIEGKIEKELIDFSRSVYDHVKAGKVRDFASQAFNLKSSSLKDSYDYLRYVRMAEKPEWIVEKHPGETGYFVTFKTSGGIRSYMAVDRKNDQWRFVYAGQ
ncbi:MAG: hypothetical protein IJS14_13095 [Lentisphaeria bacterium]|nr:hypothetical protein [Lentisphaeria bacterium]